MRTVTADALVGASRDEVWDLYDDIAGMPRWMSHVRDIAYVSGPTRVGCVYRERSLLFGLPITSQWEVAEHRRPARQVHVSVSGRIARTRVVAFEARGSGTWVHQAAELRSSLWGPIGWLHELLAGIYAGWEVQASASAAKRWFEGDPRR